MINFGPLKCFINHEPQKYDFYHGSTPQTAKEMNTLTSVKNQFGTQSLLNFLFDDNLKSI
jgi:hypothetical protein